MNVSEILRLSPEFSSLSISDINTLDQALVVRRYQPGHEFCRHLKADGSVYLVLEGEISVTQSRVNHRTPFELDRLGRGSLFGTFGQSCDRSGITSCRAVSPVIVAVLPPAACRLLFGAESTLSQHVQQVAARQLIHDLRVRVRRLRRYLGATMDSSPESVLQESERRQRQERRAHHERRINSH